MRITPYYKTFLFIFILLLCGTVKNLFAQTVADFTSSVTQGCSPLSVQFTDMSAGTPSSWFWDFGNGQTSTLKNPLTVYTSAGIYSVSLTVQNALGETDDTVMNAYIIADAIPLPQFTAIPSAGCVPLIVNFTDQSIAGSGTLTKWFWDFGDGFTDSTNANPAHTYTATATYNVKLTVENSNGCRDSIVIDTIIHSGIRPIPFFTATPLSDCAKNPFTFKNLTTGTVTSWRWDFGDSDSSTKKNPQHYFTDSGYMTIKLYATNNGCVDSFIRNDYVFVKPPYVKIRYNFSCSSPYTRNFEAKYVGVSSFYWDFGDGTTSTENLPVHVYADTGTYIVKLFAFGAECDYKDSALVYIIDETPILNFTADKTEICRLDTVKFAITGFSPQYLKEFAWDYGDGSVSSFSISNKTSHIYTKTGTYYPSVITWDIQGCYDTIIAPFKIDIYGPQAAFNTSDVACVKNAAIFTDQTTGDGIHPLVNWTWAYGDGITEVITSPPFSHTYNNAGSFSIKLKVVDSNGCQDSIEKTNALIVVEKPVAGFSLSDTVSCFGDSLYFSDNSQGQLLGRNWYFGDGDTSTALNPVHVYTTTGNKTVSIIIGNQSGCSDTSVNIVSVMPLPNVNAGLDSVICLGQSLVLQPSGASNYTWSTGISLNCTTCQNPSASPQTNTTYKVTGTDTFGCTAMDSLSVTVKLPFTVSLTSISDTVCIGSSAQLFASGAELYNWQPPAGLNNAGIANPVATPLTTTLYTVTGSDSKNCFTNTATVNVLVSPYPVFNIIDSSVTLSGGTNYLIKVNNSTDIVSWHWSPPTDLSCTSCPQPTAKANKIIQYTAIASNAYGCSVSDKITIKGLCNNEVVFIPNTFSPNGDNINDRFFPRGAGLYLVKSMRIFNRLGQVVFNKINFPADVESEGWNGTLNTKKLPQDVYIYFMEIICNDGKLFTVKGDITLL